MKRSPLLTLAAAGMAIALLAACGGGASPSSVPSSSASATPSSSPNTSPTSSSGIGSATAARCPNGEPTSSGSLNCAALPLGDLKYSTTTPTVGEIYDCSTPSGGHASASAGPWIDSSSGTWDGSTDADGKISVQGTNALAGQFSVTSDGVTRTISGNAEPIAPVTVGTFPISRSDPAYQYDGNPNSIETHTFSFQFPADPQAASQPHCVSGGAIGIALDGVAIYDGFDANGFDAVAREVQDSCHGHPDSSDVYHYHGWLQACVSDSGSPTQNSSLLGYAADGYGIYGPWYNGKILTTADLDACHGTTSIVDWDGRQLDIYHYVSTYDFPYTIGCFHGTPVKLLTELP